MKSKKLFIYVEFSTDDDNDNKKYQKLRYYYHYTKKFRGATHDICNLR